MAQDLALECRGWRPEKGGHCEFFSVRSCFKGRIVSSFYSVHDIFEGAYKKIHPVQESPDFLSSQAGFSHYHVLLEWADRDIPTAWCHTRILSATEQLVVKCPRVRARASYTQSKREHWGVRQPQRTGCGAWFRLPAPGANQSWRDPEPANAAGMSAPSCQHKKGLSCLHVPVLTCTQTASCLSVGWVSTRDPSESALPGIHRLLVMSLWIVLNLLP